MRHGATGVFADATFKLHKWNSNVEKLEPKGGVSDQDENTYAKQQLGAKGSESKILGLPWDKQNDTLQVMYPQESTESTKRGVLANGNRVSTAVYAVVNQELETSQGLVAAKARLAKRSTTIPRLELISAYMATNLICNVKNALAGFPVTDLHCWLDINVLLHWIQDHGEYKQYLVVARVHKIQAHQEITWHHVPTTENPADLGSRGGSVTNAELWWNGPNWLGNPDVWPPEIIAKPSTESKAKAKMTRKLLPWPQRPIKLTNSMSC